MKKISLNTAFLVLFVIISIHQTVFGYQSHSKDTYKPVIPIPAIIQSTSSQSVLPEKVNESKNNQNQNSNNNKESLGVAFPQDIYFGFGATDRLTQKGVTKLQMFLTPKYFNHPPTGYFGLITKKALIQYQEDNGLIETGKMDKQTILFINTQIK